MLDLSPLTLNEHRNLQRITGGGPPPKPPPASIMRTIDLLKDRSKFKGVDGGISTFAIPSPPASEFGIYWTLLQNHKYKRNMLIICSGDLKYQKNVGDFERPLTYLIIPYNFFMINNCTQRLTTYTVFFHAIVFF